MIFRVAHELPGRLRLRCPVGSFTKEEGRAIGALLETQPGVQSAIASFATGSILIHHDECAREGVLAAVRVMDRSFYGQIGSSLLPDASGESLGGSLASMLGGVIFRAALPGAVRYAVTFWRAAPLLLKGIKSLVCKGRVNVSVLDASALGVSLIRRDFKTAAVITTLLALGDLLESWTHNKSKESLTDSLALNVDKIWVKRGGVEEQIPMSGIALGDLVVVRAGGVIPVDGVVAEGDAMVNQSAMTGESEPVHRVPDLSVYAGTVVEDGELVVRVTAFDSETRIHKIADMIMLSEALKADIQNRAEKMADAIVPYSFLLAAGIYLLTRDATRATAALLVDYSCAIKLSAPLAILSAMREASKRGILVKGGKFLEALACSDTVVFDKTGTLTVSSPRVASIVPFGYERDMVLRTAACLEEHFPHSIARAVVKQAERENLSHREEHSTVEYAVAHGIASLLGNERVLIGSAHFVLEDEAVPITPDQIEAIEEESGGYSPLYLAIGGRLAGVICIEDPMRGDAPTVTRQLREAGIKRIAMLTGDSSRVAENVAEKAGIDEFWPQLLPEGKTGVIRQMKGSCSGVIMVGDGINDAPALAEADVGVAMGGGADIARQAADVVLTENRLADIVCVRRIGLGAMRKIRRSYFFIVAANSLLLALGLGGLITPGASALLHNMATVGVSVYSLTPILEAEEGRRAQGATS